MVWGLRVLVVDRDPVLRSRIRSQCELEGWIVEEASLVSEAAWASSGFGADVIVLAANSIKEAQFESLLLPDGIWTLIHGEAGISENGVLRISSSDPVTITRALAVMEDQIKRSAPGKTRHLEDLAVIPLPQS